MSRRPRVHLQADEEPAGVGAPGAAPARGLAADLRRLLRGKALVVGVGNPARGDDGLGPAVIEELQRAGCVAQAPLAAAPALLDVGDAPERYLGPMAESGAEVIVFVDAVDFGGRAGEAVLLEEQDLPQRSCVTHRSSLGLVMRYLREQAGLRSVVLGVQPGSVAMGSAMTPAVRAAVPGVAAAICEALAADVT